MTVREKVEGFLNSVNSFTIGYKGIDFLMTDEVEAEQDIFTKDSHGRTLITGKRGDWKEEWLVIGYEDLSGNPIFVNTKSPVLRVSSAQTDDYGWDPFYIAESIDNLKGIVELLQTVAQGRADENELEANPISDEERQRILDEIKKQNPNVDMWFWAGFLENE